MKIPVAFRACFTKAKLAEMLAPTYAAARGVDPNEAYLRLEQALSRADLTGGLQEGLWRAALEAKPELAEAQLVERTAKRLSRRKRWKPPRVQRRAEGAWAALTILVDVGAGVASGEAWDLLESEDGQRMLSEGYEAAGRHLMAQLD